MQSERYTLFILAFSEHNRIVCILFCMNWGLKDLIGLLNQPSLARISEPGPRRPGSEDTQALDWLVFCM
jgi:hypothetical protein